MSLYRWLNNYEKSLQIRGLQISNFQFQTVDGYRILNIENSMVTFKYRDRQDGDKEKIATISAEKFIQRFFLHILPHGFMRIRYFGFLANRCKKENISKIRGQLGNTHKLPEKAEETAVEIIKRLTGIDLTVCPECKKGKSRSIFPTPAISLSIQSPYI